MLKTCTTLIVGIFEQICFDEVFLMALSHGSSPPPPPPNFRGTKKFPTKIIGGNLSKNLHLEVGANFKGGPKILGGGVL